FFFIGLMALVVWFLDAAAGGCIVAGDGQPQSGAVTKLVLFLNQAFAESPAADDRGAIPILEGSGEHLAGRSRAFVRQQGQLTFFEQAVPAAVVFDLGGAGSYRIYDELVAVEEIVGYFDGLLQDPAAVAAQIEDQALEALLLQPLHGLCELRMGRL